MVTKNMCEKIGYKGKNMFLKKNINKKIVNPKNSITFAPRF